MSTGKWTRHRSIEHKRDWRRRRGFATTQAERLRMRARLYGIYPSEIVAQWERQGFACAICRQSVELEGRSSHVDHDHDTRAPRGIVCRRCNVLIGMLESLKREGLDPVGVGGAAWTYIQSGGCFVRSVEQGDLGLLDVEQDARLDSPGESDMEGTDEH